MLPQNSLISKTRVRDMPHPPVVGRALLGSHFRIDPSVKHSALIRAQERLELPLRQEQHCIRVTNCPPCLHLYCQTTLWWSSRYRWSGNKQPVGDSNQSYPDVNSKTSKDPNIPMVVGTRGCWHQPVSIACLHALLRLRYEWC